MERKPFNWREFLILWAVGVWGVIAVLPYTLTVQAPLIEKMPPLPVPLAVVIAVQIVQNAVLVAIAVGLGLLLATRIGLDAPLLEARLAGEAVGQRLRALLVPSVLAGAAAGIAIIVLDLLVFASGMPAAAPAGEHDEAQGCQPAPGVVAEVLFGLGGQVCRFPQSTTLPEAGRC